MPDYREHLRQIIREQPHTQKELARRAHTTEQYVSMILAKRRHPRMEILIDILAACGYELQIVPTMREANHD